MKLLTRFVATFFATTCLLTSHADAAETLKVSLLITNGEHRLAIRKLTKHFEAENPGIKLDLDEKPNEQYHKWMENWEQSDTDGIWVVCI